MRRREAAWPRAAAPALACAPGWKASRTAEQERPQERETKGSQPRGSSPRRPSARACAQSSRLGPFTSGLLPGFGINCLLALHGLVLTLLFLRLLLGRLLIPRLLVLRFLFLTFLLLCLLLFRTGG